VRGDTLSGKNGCEDEANLLRPFCTSLAARAQAHGRITASRVQPSAQPNDASRAAIVRFRGD
jgi:hypothetical protein